MWISISQVLMVYSGPNYLGKIVEYPTWWNKKLEVWNSKEEKVFDVKGPCLVVTCGCNNMFDVNINEKPFYLLMANLKLVVFLLCLCGKDLKQGWATISGPHCAFIRDSRATFRRKRLYQWYKNWSSRAGCGPRAVSCPLLI